MNCKQGDLAVIVRSWGPNYGKLVTVLQFAGPYTFTSGRAVPDAWLVRVEQLVIGEGGKRYESGAVRHVSDSDLRPIRDPGDDAVDETLEWLPAPSHREPA